MLLSTFSYENVFAYSGTLEEYEPIYDMVNAVTRNVTSSAKDAQLLWDGLIQERGEKGQIGDLSHIRNSNTMQEAMENTQNLLKDFGGGLSEESERASQKILDRFEKILEGYVLFVVNVYTERALDVKKGLSIDQDSLETLIITTKYRDFSTQYLQTILKTLYPTVQEILTEDKENKFADLKNKLEIYKGFSHFQAIFGLNENFEECFLYSKGACDSIFTLFKQSLIEIVRKADGCWEMVKKSIEESRRIHSLIIGDENFSHDKDLLAKAFMLLDDKALPIVGYDRHIASLFLYYGQSRKKQLSSISMNDKIKYLQKAFEEGQKRLLKIKDSYLRALEIKKTQDSELLQKQGAGKIAANEAKRRKKAANKLKKKKQLEEKRQVIQHESSSEDSVLNAQAASATDSLKPLLIQSFESDEKEVDDSASESEEEVSVPQETSLLFSGNSVNPKSGNTQKEQIEDLKSQEAFADDNGTIPVEKSSHSFEVKAQKQKTILQGRSVDISADIKVLSDDWKITYDEFVKILNRLCKQKNVNVNEKFTGALRPKEGYLLIRSGRTTGSHYLFSIWPNGAKKIGSSLCLAKSHVGNESYGPSVMKEVRRWLVVNRLVNGNTFIDSKIADLQEKGFFVPQF